MTPEQFDKWRVIPRLLVLMYSALLYHVSMWFMSIPDPNTQQTTFVSTIVGVAGLIFNFYVQTGNRAGNKE